jgi:hypothetical protein
MNTPTTPTQKRGTLLLLLMAFLLKVVSVNAQVASFIDDGITLSRKQTSATAATTTNYAGTSNTSPYRNYAKLGNSSSSPVRPTPLLGTYDLNGATSSALTLTAASVRAVASVGDIDNTGVRAKYRVYLSGTSVNTTTPAFNPIILSAPTTGNIYSTTTSQDLLSGLVNGGTYILEVAFEMDVTDSTNTRTFYDPGTSPAFTASFYVTPPATAPPGGTTTWQSTNTGTNGNLWFVAANWSNGVPTAESDAVIPENQPGSSIVFPVLNNRAVNYAVRNLTLEGTTNSGRAQLTIQTAVLHVYGNISQLSGGLYGTITDRPGVADSTRNSTLMLLGNNQFITGQLSVPDVIIAGTGTKSVANALFPTNTLSLRPKSVLDGVILQTASLKNGSYVFDTTTNSFISLGSTGIINDEQGSNETITSYVKGVLTAETAFVAGKTYKFGNIGLDFTPNHPATLVTVQRIIGDPLNGPTSSTNPRAVPIKRQYFIKGDDNSSSTSTIGSTNTVVLHYLPSAFELNGIMESNLMLFSSKSSSGSASFTPLYGTLDTGTRTVTQADVPSQPSYYLTLGDKTNPLPVTLVSFSATRNADNAQLVWATASEKNNRGFEVQVSTDGKAFRTLGFVASQSGNSSTKLDYKYTDTEAGKTGARYYRLHQLDFDGTDSYSPVRVVSFDGATLASELSIYPNPVTGDDTRLLIQTTEVGNARLRITDLMGRTIIDQSITTANGSTETKLAALANAKSGTYLAQLTLPSGQTKTIKVQKQ